ncbi:hypothetical protein BHM03_00060063 [Ensete ventricosum]|nr:hypothetical protein BHM03_00060063 [Ensete ventricosum]
MEQHYPTLAFVRVHVLDLCSRKASCLCSMFHLLCRLPSCSLDTSLSSTQVALLSICIELIVALAPTIPRVSPPLSTICTLALSVHSFNDAMVAPPLDLVMHPSMHYLIPQLVWFVAHDSPSREPGPIPPRYISCWSNFSLCILPSGSFGDHHSFRLLRLADNLCIILPTQMRLLDCDYTNIAPAIPFKWLHSRL